MRKMKMACWVLWNEGQYQDPCCVARRAVILDGVVTRSSVRDIEAAGMDEGRTLSWLWAGPWLVSAVADSSERNWLFSRLAG